MTHLYTQSALEAATQQELLIKSFSDPSSDNWRASLQKNETALSGVTEGTRAALQQMSGLSGAADSFTEHAEVARKSIEGIQTQASKPAMLKVEADTSAAPAKVKVYETVLPTVARPITTPISADTKQATSDLTDYVSGPVNDASQPITTQVNANTDDANSNLTDYNKHIAAIPDKKDTVFTLIADQAIEVGQHILDMFSHFVDKNVTVTIHEQHITSTENRTW